MIYYTISTNATAISKTFQNKQFATLTKAENRLLEVLLENSFDTLTLVKKQVNLLTVQYDCELYYFNIIQKFK
jgi:hypothetical protein